MDLLLAAFLVLGCIAFGVLILTALPEGFLRWTLIFVALAFGLSVIRQGAETVTWTDVLAMVGVASMVGAYFAILFRVRRSQPMPPQSELPSIKS